jgi:hypothetical protein
MFYTKKATAISYLLDTKPSWLLGSIYLDYIYRRRLQPAILLQSYLKKMAVSTIFWVQGSGFRVHRSGLS